MKIYNATKYQLTVPISRGKYITVKPQSCSNEFIGTAYLVSVLVSSKSSDEVAIICAGPSDMALCANVSAAPAYVVQSLDAAIKKFLPKEEIEQLEEVSTDLSEVKPEEVADVEPEIVAKVESPTVKIGIPVSENTTTFSEVPKKVSVAKLGEEVTGMPMEVEVRTYDSPLIDVEEEKVVKPVVRKKVVRKPVEKNEVVVEKPVEKKTTVKKTTTKKATKKA